MQAKNAQNQHGRTLFATDVGKSKEKEEIKVR